MKTIDSIQRPAPKSAVRPAEPSVRPPATGARFTRVQGVRRRVSIPWRMLLALFASPALIGVAFLNIIGMGIVVLYGAAAVVFRIPSRYTFMLALMSFLFMVGARLGAYKDLAQTLAVFVYILLAIGVISLAVELKSARRLWFKKH